MSGGANPAGTAGLFRRLPLFALTGPSGAGKSTVGPALVERLGGRAVVLEQDVLWTAGLRDDVDGHPEFRATWLRTAAMIAQNGRPVAERLRARPAWRGWDEPRIAETCEFAAWLQAEAASFDPPVRLFDTTRVPLVQAVDHVVTWFDALANVDR